MRGFESLPGLRGVSPPWLDRLAGLWPDRVALFTPEDGHRYTFSELRHRANAVACGLTALGVQQGDRVATLMHNGVEALDLLFACGRLGAILVPLNWRLAEPEIVRLLADVEPRVIAAGPEFLQTAHAGAGGATLVSLDGGPETTFADLLATPGEPPPLEVHMDDPWLILYTGGTTGIPKGAVLTHGSMTWNAINTAVSWGLSETDIGPSFTPMFHTGGWNVFTLPLLLLGGRVILPRSFDPAEALRILECERPTLLFFVPTMFQLVAEQPGFAAADLSSLRWAISGGAPLPASVVRAWQDKVAIFKQGYGLTEVGPNNFATSDSDARRVQGATVGKLTVFVRARIVDDQGQDVPVGTPGELLLAGPHVGAGYWRRPEATAEAIRDGWFHTGDVARRDEEGFYYIVDRKKDMIITGGENVYPAEVEACLYEHPAVRDVAVVGLPDPVWGEAVNAVLAFKPGQTAGDNELREHTRARLARYKVPKTFRVVDDLPKNAVGKILRTEARKMLGG